LIINTLTFSSSLEEEYPDPTGQGEVVSFETPSLDFQGFNYLCYYQQMKRIMDSNRDNSIIIIGAGFAGLATGIYARMNGYKTQIFEMHDKPGGLCTAWKRKGFTFDSCIHWLVGSSPVSSMYDFWEEVGIVQGREFVNMDEYMRFEGNDGRTLVFYTDIDRLEKHLMEFSPQDKTVIKEFIDGIRLCLPFDSPSKKIPLLKRIAMHARMALGFITHGKKMQEWMKTTAGEFAGKFRDPVLREALREIWFPEFSMFFMLFTFAYLHNRNAGYPLGGSMPMSLALESRFKELGGIINYKKRVEKIITENNNAAGIKLDDGTEIRASRVISAADGYSTIFKMLDGKYADEKTKEPYEKWPVFPPLIYIGLGVNRVFNDLPLSVSGMTISLKNPVEIGDAVRERLGVHIYNHDPSMAPQGKTSIILILNTDYDYWKKLSQNRVDYDHKKEEIVKTVIEQLEQRFPGISSQVEVTDIATPMTFERYTGNWKGSFEGWLITPENSYTMMKPMPARLPGLGNFYMCGQWVGPGGGLPTGVIHGRKLIKEICKEDKKKFNCLKIKEP
jgi:phytoene dehydrogenase-like protein